MVASAEPASARFLDRPSIWCAYFFAIAAWATAALATLGTSPLLSSAIAAIPAAYALGAEALPPSYLMVPSHFWLPAVLIAVCNLELERRSVRHVVPFLGAITAAAAAATSIGAISYGSSFVVFTAVTGAALAALLFCGTHGQLADPRVIALARAFGLILAAVLTVSVVAIFLPVEPYALGAAVNVTSGALALRIARVSWAEREADMDADVRFGTPQAVLEWAWGIFQKEVQAQGFEVEPAVRAIFDELYLPGATTATRNPRSFRRWEPLVRAVMEQKGRLAAMAPTWTKSSTVGVEEFTRAEMAHFDIKKWTPLCPPAAAIGSIAA